MRLVRFSSIFRKFSFKNIKVIFSLRCKQYLKHLLTGKQKRQICHQILLINAYMVVLSIPSYLKIDDMRRVNKLNIVNVAVD